MRSYLLRSRENGETFFVSGDAVFDPAMADKVRKECEGSPNGTYVFVTAYQLIEEPSRAFLSALAPSEIYLIHQPQPDDEASESVEGIKDIGVKNPPGGITVLEPKPMSWL